MPLLLYHNVNRSSKETLTLAHNSVGSALQLNGLIDRELLVLRGIDAVALAQSVFKSKRKTQDRITTTLTLRLYNTHCLQL